MKIKTKHKSKYRFLYAFVLLFLCFSIVFNNQGTVQVCHALASWTPNGGFQPGISATLPGDNITPIITPTVPYIPSLSDSMNADGSLKAYSSLKVKNDKISTDYSGGWTYGSFVEYFTVKRTDGRKIYDDDGVFDVSWWKNGDFGYSDEIIDYQSEIWVKTTLCQYNWNGFLGTVLNAKFESGAYFDITWDRGEDPDDSISVNVHDKDANTMGSGKYRNWGINPGNESYKLCDWDYCSSPYITIVLRGTAYWENGWWGGTGNKVSNLYSFMSGFMPRSNRIWSNTLSANNGAIQVGNNFFCAQPFVATASNLNNFVKVNDIKMTPITDKNVIPFKEGFRIAIADEGKTKVSIENGGENQYTDYNCFVDSCIPDVNLVYLNSNGLDRLQESAVSISSTGAKSQVVSGGIFKDQVQINFGANENESPEKAYVTYNGLSREIASGTWLSEDGDYKVVVQDLAGNEKTLKFTIDTHSSNYNVDRLANTKEYKVSKWYLTAIPYGFSDYGTYSYLNYNEAIAKAKTSERQNLVTNYTLDNIDDFHYTNLVASGDEVKTGSYWYYKSINNPDLYVYYFTESLLEEAIEKYAKSYVSSPKYFNYKSDIFPNDYGTIINSDIYHNLWSESKTPAYISNDFIFRQQSELESYKIYYDYIEDGQNGWTEFVYNISFKEQTNGHGLYLIKEIDYVGHETYCYAFLDLQAPVLDVTAKVYGANDSFNHTISKNDIPLNGELIFYYEDFTINQIIEDDTWYVMQIKNPDGTVNRYTHVDSLSNFDDMPTGEYQITLYDRVNNNFSFKICLLGKAPKVKFETINNNEQMKITILSGEEYNQITDLKIYRNDNLLNGELGYDEYPDDDTNEIINISIATSRYVFGRGGLYKVEITDNFGRTTSHEFKFEKDLPLGVLKGVKHNGKTNKNVEFIFDSIKYTAVVFENGNPLTPPSTLNESGILTTLKFNANENINNEYKIILYDNTDFENLNIYKFTIRTVPPAITLYGVNNNGTTSTDVYALWEIQSGYKATYKINDEETVSYLNGQILTTEGVYIITLTDDLGNENTKLFTIDKTLDFTIYQDITPKETHEIRYTNSNIQIVNNEPLNIEIKKDNEPYEYSFGTYFNDEGFYLVKIFDTNGNVKYFEFEIDKTAPVANLIGVENNKTTSGFVQVTWEEENITSTIFRDGNYLGNYTSGSEIKLNGTYEVKVGDLAGNFTKFNFKIDNKIEFDINTFYGGISNGDVRVVAKEELTIEMYRNGELVDYAFEQILKEDGYYEFILTDILGNQTAFNFNIQTKPLNRIEKRFESFIQIMELQKNEEIQELEIIDNTLYLVDEAEYKVTVLDKTTNKYFTFDLVLDTTAPTIQLVGAENGGQTKGEVWAKNPSENPVYITALNNAEQFEYSIGEKIKNVGTYNLIVKDEAGNETVYEFTIIYALNGASIALFGAMLAVVVILIIFLIKNKVGFYKGKAEITTIEETAEEIDSIEEK